MRKRIIALIVALSVVLVGGGTVLAATVADIIRDNKQDAQLKAEKEKTYIADLFHDQGHIYMTPDEPKAGEDITLILNTTPFTATQEVTFTSSDTNEAVIEIEKVDDRHVKVTGVASGSATITATAGEVTATVTVTVTE